MLLNYLTRKVSRLVLKEEKNIFFFIQGQDLKYSLGKGTINKDYLGDVLTSQADRFSKEELNAMLAASPIDEFGNLDYKGLAYVITHGQDDEE